MKRTTAVLTLVVLLVTAAPAGAALDGLASAQSEGYSGTHVSFQTESDAVVDYSVDGRTVATSIEVQSADDASTGTGLSLDAGLSAMTNLEAAGVSLETTTEAGASVRTESGAEMSAHDNARGVLVVDAGESGQYVTVNVSSGASAEHDGDRRVVVATDDGSETAFLVVGDGNVTVNDDGHVSAELNEQSKLVTRSYADGREEDDRSQERLVSDGTATAEAYVSDGGDSAANVVQYGDDTAVEVTETGEGTVRMTAERSTSEGTVLLTTVSESAVESFEDLQVTVDGAAAAEASSYGELESAADDGSNSMFLVRQQSSASASADVVVAVDHFSERDIAMQSDTDDGGATETATTDGSDDDSGTTDTTTGTGPGFGVVATLVGLLVFVGGARFRRR